MGSSVVFFVLTASCYGRETEEVQENPYHSMRRRRNSKTIEKGLVQRVKLDTTAQADYTPVVTLWSLEPLARNTVTENGTIVLIIYRQSA